LDEHWTDSRSNYITLAEKIFPVIEVDAGRHGRCRGHQGISLQGTLDAGAQDREEFPHLSARSPNLRRSNDDDE
jgi:conjugal transfer pilus assembly protein TraB